MRPSLAYCGNHERDTIDSVGITIRFLDLLAEMGFDRECELSQLPPAAGVTAKPFSVEGSKLLMHNDSNADLFMER